MAATKTFPAPVNFTASHNGPRLPAVNNRVAPTDASKYVQRTDTLTVETYYDDNLVSYARLYEASTAEVGGKGLVVRAKSGAKTYAGTITYPPGPGQYYFNPNMGFLFFNKADNADVVIVSYTARGSIIAAEEINWLWDAINSVGRPWLEQVVELPPMVNKDFPALVVLQVYEIADTSEYIINPADVELRVFNPDSEAQYYTRLINKGANTRKFKIRAIPKLTPEK